jgi:hypothetical protein
MDTVCLVLGVAGKKITSRNRVVNSRADAMLLLGLIIIAKNFLGIYSFVAPMAHFLAHILDLA